MDHAPEVNIISPNSTQESQNLTNDNVCNQNKNMNCEDDNFSGFSNGIPSIADDNAEDSNGDHSSMGSCDGLDADGKDIIETEGYTQTLDDKTLDEKLSAIPPYSEECSCEDCIASTRYAKKLIRDARYSKIAKNSADMLKGSSMASSSNAGGNNDNISEDLLPYNSNEVDSITQNAENAMSNSRGDEIPNSNSSSEVLSNLSSTNIEENLDCLPNVDTDKAPNCSGFKNRAPLSGTPTRKAKRIKFLRNGDSYHQGINIPVSHDRFKTLESLCEELTRALQYNSMVTGAVRSIYTKSGRKITSLENLEHGEIYICCCNKEDFKNIEYNTTLHKNTAKAALTMPQFEKNNIALMTPPQLQGIIGPRIVILICYGVRPRKVMRFLLNKYNSRTFDQVLTAMTQRVKLDSGCVRKAFTLSGRPVLELAEFFMLEHVFFVYGSERVNCLEDFHLDKEEQKALQAIQNSVRKAITAGGKFKAKMPSKTKNLNSYDHRNTMVNEEISSWPCGFELYQVPDVIRQRFSIGSIIGNGSFGFVLKVMERSNRDYKALKVIDKSKYEGKEYSFVTEISILKRLEHPNIISLLLDAENKSYMCLVMEYVSGGDLFDALKAKKTFPEDKSRVVMRQIASALAYMHSFQIVHRDLKPENILVELDAEGYVSQLKLADFGIAVEATEPLYLFCGTLAYLAPEMIQGEGYGCEIDVWAAGVILFTLLCGFAPFTGDTEDDVYGNIVTGSYEFAKEYWAKIKYGAIDLIVNLLQYDPEVRFTGEDILEHFWTKGQEY